MKDNAIYWEHIELHSGKILGHTPVEYITKAELKLLSPTRPIFDHPTTLAGGQLPERAEP